MKTLLANDLASKAGFGDGDMLDGLIYRAYPNANLGGGGHHLWFEHEVLARCVERFLLPKLPPITVNRIGTAHNPIRADDEFHEMLKTCGISVEIEDEKVLEIAAEVANERGIGGALLRTRTGTPLDK